MRQTHPAPAGIGSGGDTESYRDAENLCGSTPRFAASLPRTRNEVLGMLRAKTRWVWSSKVDQPSCPM